MTEPPQNDLSFEQALAALEKIVRELEDGQTGLEQALASYEEGVKLLQRCVRQLAQAEQRILLLTGETEEGKPVTRPFQHTATAQKQVPEAETEPVPPPRRKKPNEMESLF